MTKSAKVLFAFGVASALCATTTLGQIVFSFDENGKGSGPGGPLPSTIAVEPVSGMATLSYMLPFPVAPGDVLLLEPTNSTGLVLSDLVRFGGANHNQVFFFSDAEANERLDLADVPVLPQPVTGAISLNEVGPEGNNGAVWAPPPGSGLPGDPPSGVGPVTYQIISDIPEPASFAFTALAGGLLLALKWRRQVARS
ncbi:MAG TPA: hypothetical protein VN578_05940 [Candidatus Binatia bacterium]|jgi:hypothetical protein|nr:hypothetical protein [Candidatus Binatia bacterium]